MADRYNVVSLVLRQGPLYSDFRGISVSIAAPVKGDFYSIRPRYLAKRLLAPMLERYGLAAIIANSAESESVVVAAHELRIPVLTLVHEFAEYVLPPVRMQNVLQYSHSVVFSSSLTEESARESGAAGNFRHSLVLPQGKSEIPALEPQSDGSHPLLWNDPLEKAFLCIGCGQVQPRKGVDLFIATAAQVAAKLGKDAVRFLWVGDGYDPLNDRQYSIWLRDQIHRSGLDDVVRIVPAVGADDLERLYRRADAMLLSSRLDPFPNVAIDAACVGLPIVCFEKTTGIAEYLAELGECRDLVVPYLDVSAAAEAIVSLVREPGRKAGIAAALAKLSRRIFSMPAYVAKLELLLDRVAELGRQEEADIEALRSAGVLDPNMIGLGDGLDMKEMIARYVRFSSSNTIRTDHGFRRPVMGFSPQVYEDRHPETKVFPFPNSLAHWAQAGRPAGPWTHEVLVLGKSPPPSPRRKRPRSPFISICTMRSSGRIS